MLALGNPNRPATRMAGGISAGRSGETLFHKGERIPPGLAPWNGIGGLRFQAVGSSPCYQRQPYFLGIKPIPLGVYIYPIALLKSSIKS